MSDERELNCREAARLMSIGYDRDLTPAEAAQLEFHLGECDDCRHFDVQLRFLHEAAGHYSR